MFKKLLARSPISSLDVTLISCVRSAAAKNPAAFIKDFNGSPLADMELWDACLGRIVAGPPVLELPEDLQLVRELKSAKLGISEGGTVKVLDGKGGRRKRHRDVSYSVAGCCWTAKRLMVLQGTIQPQTLESRKLDRATRPHTAGIRGKVW